MMKVIRETERLLVYEDTHNDLEIAFKLSSDECYSLGGLSVCDFCNNKEHLLFLCPELGSNAICSNCFKVHTKNVAWHTSDTYPVINTLLSVVVNYNLSFKEQDYDIIDEFLQNKKQRDIRIRKVIGRNQ